MAIVLRLDKAALMHLLEENADEFKLELTTAVIAEAARSMGLYVKAVCKEYVRKERGSEIAKVVRDEFANVDWAGRTTSLKDDLRTRITSEVRARISETVRGEIERFDSNELTQRVTDGLIAKVSHFAEREVRRLLKDTVTASIVKAVAEESGGVSQG